MSLGGVSVAGVSLAAFLGFLVLDSLDLLTGPYSGLFGFLLVPACGLVGLSLIVLGFWRETRRRRRGRTPWRWPVIDLTPARTRKVVAGVAVLALTGGGLLAVALVEAVEYSESNAFCGPTCHVPMQPQATAYQAGAHARLDCVRCHVAPGAAGSLAAKMNGPRQLYRLLTSTYSRPVRSSRSRMPVPAETCGSCHGAVEPELQTVRTWPRYADDETSTVRPPVRLIMLAGRSHWHARPGVLVEYQESRDDSREVVYIRATIDGEVTEYFASGGDRSEAPLYRMDCLDCHSRPAHRLTESAEQLVDRALFRGDVTGASLPFARASLVDVLTREYPDRDSAAVRIAARLRELFGEGPDTDDAIAVAQGLYNTHVFPAMNVGWGTYQTQMQHQGERGGCFRCHDGQHVTRTGPTRTVRRDCSLCHLQG